jgi:hypothetical protein
MRIGIFALAAFALAGTACAGPPPETRSLNMDELKALVERIGYHVTVEEGAGYLHITDGTSWPVRLGLAACEPSRRCQVIRAYTRFTIGDSEKGAEAAKDFAANFTSVTVIQLVVGGEAAVEVGRDIALTEGRTDGELKGEIDEAVQDAIRLRLKLMASDQRLKMELDR